MADDGGGIPSNDGGQRERYNSDPGEYPTTRIQKQRRSTRIRKPSQAVDRGVRRKPDSGASHEYLTRVRKLLERVKEQVKRDQEGNRPSRSRSKVRNSRNKSREFFFREGTAPESDGSSPDIPEGREEFKNPTKQEKPAARRRQGSERQSVPRGKGEHDEQEQVEEPKIPYGLPKGFRDRFMVDRHQLSQSFMHIIFRFFLDFLISEKHYLDCTDPETAMQQIRNMENVLRTLLFRIVDEIGHTITRNSGGMTSLLYGWMGGLRQFGVRLQFEDFIGKEEWGRGFKFEEGSHPESAVSRDGGPAAEEDGGDESRGAAYEGGDGGGASAEDGAAGDGGGEPAAAADPAAPEGSAPGSTTDQGRLYV